MIQYLFKMGRYNFKGDLSQVSERQLEYIGDVLDKRNVKECDVLFEPVGKVGDNYVANVMRIIVQENGKTFKMVAKIAPTNDHIRQAMNTAGMFLNEHTVYTEILPKFDQLQIEAGVPKEEMFRHPECYGTLMEDHHEIILLEDLRESDLAIMSRFEPMSHECVNMALKNFAKFHSFSYALKKLEPETYKAFKSKLTDMLTDHMTLQRDNVKVYFEGLEKMASDCMPDDKYKNVLKGSVSEFVNVGLKCIKADQNSRYSVIRQGDGWNNNIMFRIKDGIPEDCVLIDYQLSYESSPVYDITYMLFNSTDHEQRLKHYHDYIDLYHLELDKSLNNFGLKANMVYPRDQLDADLKRYGKYAFANSIMISSVIIKTPEEAAVMKKSMEEFVDPNAELPSEIYAQEPETLVLFRKRIQGLVDSFLEFGLIFENRYIH